MRKTRLICGTIFFLASEFALFGAAEGAQKWLWIEAGTVPNAPLAVGFYLPRKQYTQAAGIKKKNASLP